jgi:hypothetical protein
VIFRSSGLSSSVERCSSASVICGCVSPGSLRAMPWATVRARFSPFAAIARLRRSASRTSRKCSGRTWAGRMFGLTCRARRTGSVPRVRSAALPAIFATPVRRAAPPTPARARPPAPGTRLTGSRAVSSANPPMLAAGPRTPAARRTSENRYLSLFWMPRLSARRRSAAALLPGAWTARISLSPPRLTSLSVSPATAWMGRVSWLRIARPGASRAARCLRARSWSSRRLVPPLARHARWSVIRSGPAGAARGLMDGGSVRPVTIACATRWR